MQKNNGTCWQLAMSLSISKSSNLISINKLQIQKIKDARKKFTVTSVLLMENYSVKNVKFSLSKCFM